VRELSQQTGAEVRRCGRPSSFSYRPAAVTSLQGNSINSHVFAGPLCDGATLSFAFTPYELAEMIPFADTYIAAEENSLKLIGTIENWPWATEGNMLVVDLRLRLSGSATLSSAKLADSAANTVTWEMGMTGGALILQDFLTRVELDTTSAGSMSVMTDESDTQRLLMALPFHRRRIRFDPNFAVLVSPGVAGRPSAGITGLHPRNDEPVNTPLIVISVALTGMAVLMVALASVAYVRSSSIRFAAQSTDDEVGISTR
jgi:hypothetical protein